MNQLIIHIDYKRNKTITGEIRCKLTGKSK